MERLSCAALMLDALDGVVDGIANSIVCALARLDDSRMDTKSARKPVPVVTIDILKRRWGDVRPDAVFGSLPTT